MPLIYRLSRVNFLYLFIKIQKEKDFFYQIIVSFIYEEILVGFSANNWENNGILRQI